MTMNSLRLFLTTITCALVLCACGTTDGNKRTESSTSSTVSKGQDPGLPDDPNIPWSSQYGNSPWDSYPF